MERYKWHRLGVGNSYKYYHKFCEQTCLYSLPYVMVYYVCMGGNHDYCIPLFDLVMGAKEGKSM